jgi:hypothetical protein
MKKRFKSGILLMIAAMFLLTMVPAMAAPQPQDLPKPDGVMLEDVIENQFTVVMVGVVPDPKYARSDEMTDGQSGVVIHTIREVVLKDKEGNKQTITIGPEAKNFDQIKEGDKVTIRVERRVAVFIGKEGLIPGSGETRTMFSAPKGSKPGAIEVKQAFITLEVLKIDMAKKAVTVRLPDNTIKTVNTPKFDLSALKVGQNVVVMQESEQSLAVTAP